MSVFSQNKSKDFSQPTQLPADESQHQEWLKANKDWWEQNPMRYDWHDAIAPEKYSKEYFREIDARFFSSSEFYLPKREIPFDRLIDFQSLKDKRVLEIGVGHGSHAQLLAAHSEKFNGIDLTHHAIESTRKRMEVFSIQNADIRQMDAEELTFDDGSFDFVWSWGVVHHSANTTAILHQISRVLKPGGKFTAMVYFRGYWNYYFTGMLVGIVKGRFFKSQSLHRVMQDHCDGAMARFYTVKEWQKELESQGFEVKRIQVMGMKPELLPIPASPLKSFLLRLIPDRIGRFFTNNLKMGSFLVSETEKK